jgi:hypothetical protein
MKSNVQIKYFRFDWSIYRLLVLNRGWKLYSHHIMIFEFVSSTWRKVELKTRFEKWITRNDVNGVSLFHLSYLIMLMVYQCFQRTPNVQIKSFMSDWSIYRLFVIDRGWKRDSPNNDIRISLLDVRHSWTKNAFWDVINMKWRQWCKFVSPFFSNKSYALPVLTKNTKCPYQVLYFWLVDLQIICAK